MNIGMSPDKIQERREKHDARKSSKNLNSELEVPTTSCTQQVPSASLPIQVVTRDCSTIYSTAANWRNNRNKRSLMFNKRLDQTNYYELSCTMREDSMMIWRIVENLFPVVVQDLRYLDKDALLRNFLPKWSVITSAIDIETNAQRYANFVSLVDFKQMIIHFYSQSMPYDCQMSPERILETFSPILAFYSEKIILPIHSKGLDHQEYMALALILLFDPSYTNISLECSEMCRQIRMLIFRELRRYQMDRNCDEMRFIETVDTLNIVEKGEKKFHEELLVCEMNNVVLHDDYRLLLKELNG